MKYRIIWSPTALRRAEQISDHIAQDSIREAVKWLNRLFDAVKRLESFPDSGRMVPELDSEKIREILFGDYRIIYQMDETSICRAYCQAFETPA